MPVLGRKIKNQYLYDLMDMIWDRIGSQGPASGQLGRCIRSWEWFQWPSYIATERQDQQEAILSRRVLGHGIYEIMTIFGESHDLDLENLMGSGLIASE
jgi:hypothetical protein